MRILVVEDDKSVANLVKQGLESDHHAAEVEVAFDGERAEWLVDGAGFDLVILDLVLPKVDGFEVLTHILAHKPCLPVLILSGRANVEDRVKGLDLGASDYMTKPFSLHELSARVRALLRRYPDSSGMVLRVEELELHQSERTVRRAGQRIDLTPHEFALLQYLMRNAGRCVTRAMIMEHVWSCSFDATTNIVDVYIKYLRDKIDLSFERKLIRTVRGVGYQLGGELRPAVAQPESRACQDLDKVPSVM
jgi:DNA-binding response OmpR family regulator